MVNVKYIVPKVVTPKSSHNPYDLVQLQINTVPVLGRPIAWDRAIVDHANLLGEGGASVVTTRVIVQCPRCGAGFETDIPPTNVDCPQCTPAPLAKPVLNDPFCNPFTAGLINFEEVNLDLIATLSELPDDTVADRLQP